MYKVGDKVVTIKTDWLFDSTRIGSVGIIEKIVNTEKGEMCWVRLDTGIYIFEQGSIKPYNEFKKKYLLLEQILNNIG